MYMFYKAIALRFSKFTYKGCEIISFNKRISTIKVTKNINTAMFLK